MHIRTLFLAFASVIVLASCSKVIKDEEVLNECAEKFATTLFNLQLEKAATYCVPQSKKYIAYYASNISEKEIKLLDSLNKTPKIDILDVCYKEGTDDSIALATCKAQDVLVFQKIGELGNVTEHITFVIPLVRRNGKWLVKMEGLLQSEKQNRD